ncbi:MAG: hypothetical protein ACKOET_00250 [Verrucomicrobiota bacterium]
MNIDLRNRQHLLLLITAALVALWAGDRLVVTPLAASWKSRSGQIASLQRSLAEGRQLLQRESAVRSRWETLRTNALPGAPSAAEGAMLRAFERWSGDSRVSITSVKPQWKQESEDYRTLECRVDAFGSLSSLARFLFEVERDPLGVRVDAVELTTRETDGSQLTLGLQVSGLHLPAPETP